jgi:hypothetical protein
MLNFPVSAVAQMKLSMLPMLLLFSLAWFFSDTSFWPEFLLAALAAIMFTGLQSLKLDREFKEGRIPEFTPEPKRRDKLVGWTCGLLAAGALYLPTFFPHVRWINTAELCLLILDVIFLWWFSIWISDSFTAILRANWARKNATSPK